MANLERPRRAVPVDEQIGLALRAYRRDQGLSQRGLAELVGVPQPTIARLERSPLASSLRTVTSLLATAGYVLAVVDTDGQPVGAWSMTDLRARDRSGRRFPAHHEVRSVRPGSLHPRWWVFHEEMGTGECGPQPTWTAEGSPFPRFRPYRGERLTYAPGEERRWL
ncbi:Helix-turn-helix domain-containing protein [Georgenia satyanarayanai]|uniref:Helix-turn-helix domain-containing protein n=1 Tax=Georgenia satyanarayanai TaxID=860221 RepID=A0A2Y9AII5_9MICO|nr:helix-turn-helix domain-containing protein [Georgenia satyanarayanai]PYF99003.1 helix-turn-helix protein [Georgenia satyanarayanai]SSA43965.1 Helix-turn-helix domain-containing protein [Georgenia satyanarayanai]